MILRPSKSRTRERPSQGFTLTEAAIMMSITGILLAAIWVAATTVYSNMRINKAVNELLMIASGVRGLGGTSGSLNIPADSDITENIIALKIPPSDMIGSFFTPLQEDQTQYAWLVKKGTMLLSALIIKPAFAVVGLPPPVILAPFPGSTIKVYSKGNNGDRFDITFLNLPSKECVKLAIMGTGDSVVTAGLVSIGMSTTSDPVVDGGGIANLPLDLGTATTNCGATNTASIAFRFTFR